MKIDWRELALGLSLTAIVMGFPYYNPATAVAAPHNAPTPGHFIGFPECAVSYDPGGGVTVTVEGTFAPNVRTAEFIIDAAPTIDYVPPEIYFSVNGVPQETATIPPSKRPSQVSITMLRVSTFMESSISTQWLGAPRGQKPYLFAGIYPTGDYADCVVSTN